MITRSLKLAASAFAALLTLAAGIPAAHAQGVRSDISKINVPFSFEVGSAHFAPGTYTISRRSFILTVEGEKNSALLMVLSEQNHNVPEKGKAVFQHIGDKFFLTQVWNAGNADHLECPRTPEMKRAQRIQQAALRTEPTATKPESVILALLR